MPCSPCRPPAYNVPHLQWGSHEAHFFESGDGLRDVLVPYFKVGLENNERCLWVTGKALNAEQARSALRAAIGDLDKRERAGQTVGAILLTRYLVRRWRTEAPTLSFAQGDAPQDESKRWQTRTCD